MTSPDTKSTRGFFVAGMGIPSCGKSSAMRLLAEKCGAHFFAEPEEPQWPSAVLERDQSGCFAAMTWFRSIRVPFYHKAKACAAEGSLALVDSYYDGLMDGLLGQSGMEWLMESDDPYFALAKNMAKLDWHHLPKPDILVVFDISKEDWEKMITARGRQLDQEQALLDSYPTQDLFWEVSQNFCAEHGISLLRFQQRYGKLEDAVEEFERVLKAEMTKISLGRS